MFRRQLKLKEEIIMQIRIDDKLVDYIEALQYERDRTNEIVAFMLSHDYDTHTPAFRQWDKDSQEAYVKYQEAKNELEKKYVQPRPEFRDKRVNWNLDFATKTLTAEAADAEKD